MFERILFPTDGSDPASAVLDHAIALALAHDAELYVLNVADTTRDSVTRIQGEVVDALVRDGERIVEAAAETARERGVSTDAEVQQGRPARTILEYAATRDIDLVVMPTHGRRGVSRLLLGSTTERVVRQSDVPVLTARPEEATLTYPYETVLVPTDGSETADQALTLGADLAAADQAALHLFSLVEVDTLGFDVRSDIKLDPVKAHVQTILDDGAALARDAGVERVTTAMDYGMSIHKAVLRYTREHDVDLVVIGTHGRTGFDRYMLGSVAEAVIRSSPVPVLVVREYDAP